MKCYKLEPLGDLEQVEVKNDLHELQRIVGGYIEIVSFAGGNPNTVIILDEEGKLKHKTPCAIWRGDVLVGTILFAGCDRHGDLCDCPMPESEIRARIGRKVIV